MEETPAGDSGSGQTSSADVADSTREFRHVLPFGGNIGAAASADAADSTREFGHAPPLGDNIGAPVSADAGDFGIGPFLRVESPHIVFANIIPAMDVDSEIEASGNLLRILNSISKRQQRAENATQNRSMLGKGVSKTSRKTSVGKNVSGKGKGKGKKLESFQEVWKKEMKNIDKIVRDYLEALKDLGYNHTGFLKLSDEMFRLLMNMMREHQRRPQHELRDWCMSVIVHLRRSYVHAGSMEDDLAICLECACTKLGSIKDLYFSDSKHRKRDLLAAIKKLDTILRELCFGIADYRRLKVHYLGLKSRVLSRMRQN